MKSVSVSALLFFVLCSTVAWGKELPQGVTNMGNVLGGDVQPAHTVISRKCTRCHTDKVIDAAIFANKDMQKIQLEMEKKGANLNANERDVLGIYWKQQNPLRKNK